MKNNNLPDINFERNMNHNYMILRSCDFFGNATEESVDFRKKMLLENDIPGLLPVSQRMVKGEKCYYYEINSLQSLDRLYSKKEIGHEELKQILMCSVRLFETLEEYLLDGSQIILKPEYIYMNLDDNKIYFTCFPEYEGIVRDEFVEFVDMILTKIDHTDNEAVMLGYKVYRYTKNPNYVMGEITHIIESSMTRYEEPIKPLTQTSQFKPTVDNYYFDYNNNIPSENIPNEKEAKKEKKKKERKSDKGIESKGMIICLIIALASIVTILSGMAASVEIYLYGAVAMSLAGTVLFAISNAKKKKQAKERAALSDGSDGIETHTYIPVTPRFQPLYIEPQESQETTCLSENALEERILIGRVNGKEITIPLTQFPATLGKQEGLSDIVVNDKAVSKMHARFEEREGRVYLLDLNSTNGTIRNGTMLDINSPVVLEVGDRLRFGRSCFTYC